MSLDLLPRAKQRLSPAFLVSCIPDLFLVCVPFIPALIGEAG
jgi:hypothetical protein